ncbi:MAG: acetolactate synthase small subunit [Candidatus Fimisoma sp.]|nr:acetolactate synthase small subunit [Bacillota bacterium]MDD7285833.1 acetolactate synthase small subunit [Bacillota bacterium]MDY4748380.1 acetolactate synthase small subunit [Candidatus Fimisoma sp.]
MKKEVVSIYVDNKANVLTRIVSLYGRRGFNIDSLTVSATNNPDISRITVVFEGDNLTLHQIVSQTEKLEVVRSIKTLDSKKSFFRELLMVKVAADKEKRREIKEITDIYRAKIISLEKETMVLELTGSPEKLDAFLKILEDYDIVDICRTGVTGIEK